MFDLNDAVIFSKVAETQGISPAARALGMPKSKVSRRMSVLVDALGIRLLERSTRSMHLTEAGEVYYRHCRRIVEEAESAVESVNSLTERPRGHLRVSASVTIGQYLLAPRIPEFVASYPDIELELQLTDRRVDVIAEGYDVVIRVGELEDSTLVSRRIGGGCAQLYASPEYIESNKAPGRLSDLGKHAFFCRSDGGGPGPITMCGPRNKRVTTEVRSAVQTGDLSVIRQIAIGGAGVALLPQYLGEPDVARQSLVNILPSWRTDPFNYYALYPSHRGITLKARAWIDFLVQYLPA